MNCAVSFCFHIYLMHHACAVRFDVMENFENFWEITRTRQGVWKSVKLWRGGPWLWSVRGCLTHGNRPWEIIAVRTGEVGRVIQSCRSEPRKPCPCAATHHETTRAGLAVQSADCRLPTSTTPPRDSDPPAEVPPARGAVEDGPRGIADRWPPAQLGTRDSLHSTLGGRIWRKQTYLYSHFPRDVTRC